MSTTAQSDRELVTQREVPFARELVWEAMTVPEHVNRWWGPDGFRNENVTMDFRIGGEWTYEMVGPDGTRYPNHVVFKEITPPSRLVFDHGDDKRIWFEVIVTLDETSGHAGHAAPPLPEPGIAGRDRRKVWRHRRRQAASGESGGVRVPKSGKSVKIAPPAPNRACLA